MRSQPLSADLVSYIKNSTVSSMLTKHSNVANFNMRFINLHCVLNTFVDLHECFLLWIVNIYLRITIYHTENRLFTDDNIIWYLKNKRPTWCHLLFYFTSYVLNMFRTLICPSSGACDYSVESPHWPCCSWFDVCWRFGVVGLELYPCCRRQQPPDDGHINVRNMLSQ